MKVKITMLLTALALSASVFAQAPNPNPNDPNRSRTGGDRGPGGGGDRGRGFNPEEFRKQMNERLKASLKVSDDEWSVIQPLVEKVQNKLRDASSSRYSGYSSRSSSSGGGSSSSNDPSRTERAGYTEREALRNSLENENASPEELKAKLAAVRQVRQKSVAELAEAREDLKKVLTVRQESVLVAYGMLE